MDIGVPNSFIPHDATTPKEPRHYEGGGGLIDLLTLVAVVLFVASAALGAGTFLYLQYLKSQSTQKQAQITQVESEFDPTLISQLTTLDNRMNAAETILASHIAPSAFFNALDQSTAATVSFNSLDLDATDLQKIDLKMDGVARDVNSIAYQADLFGKAGVITNAIFSGIDQQSDGVHFAVDASVNPTVLNYQTLVAGAAPAGVNQLPASSSTAAVQSSGSSPSPFTGTASQTPQSASGQ